MILQIMPAPGWSALYARRGATGAIEQIARRELGEFYGTASLYGLGHGIGMDQWEAPFLNEADAREVGATSGEVMTFKENMTLALRVVFQTEGKMVVYGDSFEVTATGARSLLG